MSEERRTAKDGKVYTKPEFQEWYGEDADTHFNEANPLLASDVSDANPDSSTSAAPAAPTLGCDSLTARCSFSVFVKMFIKIPANLQWRA